LSAGGHAVDGADLLKKRVGDGATAFEKLLLALPRASSIDRVVQQAGVDVGPGRLMVIALLAAVSAFLVALVLNQPVPVAVALAAIAGALPFFWLVGRRNRRLTSMEKQLPDALDLISRALRAGHAFPSALEMVGDQMPEPIGGEFQTTFEELNYGVSMHDALMNMAARVPGEDIRFFVIAVLLQRETGGNLAEIIDNISKLVRERFKLLGTVRVLSAEGRMSAWVLTILPFATALGINLVNPGFMAVLWQDPAGRKMVAAAMIVMVFGILWMWRLVKIRV